MIADGLVELNHPSVAPCKIVCNEVVKSFCKFLYLSNGCLSSFVCNDGIISLRTLGYMRRSATSEKSLHIIAKIIVCLANSFCWVLTC